MLVLCQTEGEIKKQRLRRLRRSTKYVRIYEEYHSVCILVGIGTLPTSPSPASVPLPPVPGGGATHLRVRGWGSSNSDDLRKSLALCLLCKKDIHIVAIDGTQ